MNWIGAGELLKIHGIDRDNGIEGVYCKWKEGTIDDNIAWGFCKQREGILESLLQANDNLEFKKNLARIRQIIQEIEIDGVPETQGLENNQETKNIESDYIHPLVWEGKKADLARIIRDLVDSKLIGSTYRDIEKHFLDKEGKPIIDVMNNLTEKQGIYSKKPEILSIQKTIRSLKS